MSLTVHRPLPLFIVCNFILGGNEKTPVIPLKAVAPIQLQPQEGAESDGKLVPWAQS